MTGQVGAARILFGMGRDNALPKFFARLNERKPVVIYASTNKVYGGMDDVNVVERATRWEYESLPFGAPETSIGRLRSSASP